MSLRLAGSWWTEKGEGLGAEVSGVGPMKVCASAAGTDPPSPPSFLLPCFVPHSALQVLSGAHESWCSLLRGAVAHFSPNGLGAKTAGDSASARAAAARALAGDACLTPGTPMEVKASRAAEAEDNALLAASGLLDKLWIGA